MHTNKAIWEVKIKDNKLIIHFHEFKSCIKLNRNSFRLRNSYEEKVNSKLKRFFFQNAYMMRLIVSVLYQKKANFWAPAN